MKKNLIKIFLTCFSVIAFGMMLKAQIPGYNIGTYTVTDCRAKFYDDGGPNNPYTSVLNTTTSYTFCIFVGSPITLTFSPNPAQTQIQAGDFITFYNGPNTGAPIIAGPFTATTAIPPIVASSGSLTIRWTENGNTVGHGWNAGWSSLSVPPPAPSASLSSVPVCNSSQLTLTTTAGVLCDSVKNSYFFVNGPMTPGVSTVIPLACNNGTTNTIQINFINPVNQNCNYTVTSTLFRKDNCDSAYKFQNITNTFSVSSCPIQASINVSPSATVCAATCNTTLMAVSPATTCLNFNYAWNNGLPPTAGPHQVCPSITTVYSCTLTEQTTLAQTIVNRTVFVVNPQITPVPNPTVCQSLAPFTLTATPVGGVWLGPGISNSVAGIFCPGCTSAGVKTLTYQIGTCSATTQINVIAISAGNPDAACLGGASFTVSGGTPVGGTWYGDPDITPGGVFTPSVLGTHTVLYTFGTCTSVVKQINVTNAITVPTVAINICKSQWWTRFYTGYGISPYGGRYFKVGPGITNNILGTFSPSLAGAGTHVITYSLASGCSATFAVNVLEIQVSPSSSVVCPSNPPFVPATTTLVPAGGTWSCSIAGAIQNSVSGLYNPSAGGVNNHTDNLIYTAANGCKDTLTMFAIRTNINRDSIFFCANSNTFQLTTNTVNISSAPLGGIYTGPGVSMTGTNYIFSPIVAGQGVHTVYYNANNCRDSVKMIVYPTSISPATQTICSSHPSFTVANVPPGGTWSGNGIITPSTGLFNPASVLAGNNYTVTFQPKAPLTCSNTAQIYVYPFVAADITNLANVYCYSNSNYTFNLSPANGTLIAPPSATNNVLNPSLVGSGTFAIIYSYGTGQCYTKDSINVRVHPPLTTTISSTNDSLCFGEASTLSITVSGGLPTVNTYTYNWSHGLLSLNNQIVSPSVTTVYSVTSTDGCSSPVNNTFAIVVSPQYFFSVATTSIQCFGISGQATVNIQPPGNYSFHWNSIPVQTSSVLIGTSGKSYVLRTKNLNTGCERDTIISVPGYNAIKALFSPNPNVSCIPFADNRVTFLDLSNGALTGTWTINGSISSYTPGQSILHEFADPGNYKASLSVLNEGNCPDTFTMDICIQESTEVFLPDIFSPNQDGENDILYIRGNGIKELDFRIFDRWGNKVFQTNDRHTGWDGTIHGKPAEPGIYVYYADIMLVNDKKISKKGEVSLVR